MWICGKSLGKTDDQWKIGIFHICDQQMPLANNLKKTSDSPLIQMKVIKNNTEIICFIIYSNL